MLVARKQCVTWCVCHCLTPSCLGEPLLRHGCASDVCCGSGCTTASRPYRGIGSYRWGEGRARGARVCVSARQGVGVRLPHTGRQLPPRPPPLFVCGSPSVRASCQGAFASLPTPSPGTQGSTRSALGRATPTCTVIACASCEGRSTVPGACGAARWSILR